jgi:hypothetical protein
MKKLVLIGDSIRQGYQAEVVRQFAGSAFVAGPSENCESSRKVLKNAHKDIVASRPYTQSVKAFRGAPQD